MVLEHESEHPSRLATVSFISAKIGSFAQTVNEWIKMGEVDSGAHPGIPSAIGEKMEALERENRELKQANEILSKASAYFATAELGR